MNAKGWQQRGEVHSLAPLLEAALTLADRGHPVLPLHTPRADGCSCGRRCGRVGKHPRGGYGLTRATVDPETIVRWWTERPSANLGLRCDALVVLDVDGDDGARSLKGLEAELGPLPETWTQTTGRGTHLLYAADVAGNSTGGLGNPAGVHLRAGRRGYIVAAPSLHANGRRYRQTGAGEAAPLPAEWLERLANSRDDRPTAATPTTNGKQTTAYGRAALEGELCRLLCAPEGARNETLNLVVFRLAQLAAGGELALGELESAAQNYALRTGLEPDEIKWTVRSAVRAGLRYPRGRK